MFSRCSIVPVALLSLCLAATNGCKKDESTDPKAEASASASAKKPQRNPVTPLVKVDPQSLKEYRINSCYYGTFTLRQARDAYMASIGTAEPSAAKVPNFGQAWKPVADKAPAPKPTAPAKGSANPLTELRKPDTLTRVPHERYARSCTAALNLKEPAMPDVDAALTAYAPYAVELAKNISSATSYYQHEEHKKDAFAKGKELHKKLMADFAKLDEMQGKLGTAVTGWFASHPQDVAKQEEGQKTTNQAFEDAKAIMTLVGPRTKVEAQAYKTAVATFEKSLETYKAFSTANAADAWAKIMPQPFDNLLKSAKDGEAKLGEKGLDNDSYIALVTAFSSVIESKHRALSRSLMAKAQASAAAAPGAAPAAPQAGKEEEK